MPVRMSLTVTRQRCHRHDHPTLAQSELYRTGRTRGPPERAIDEAKRERPPALAPQGPADSCRARRNLASSTFHPWRSWLRILIRSAWWRLPNPHRVAPLWRRSGPSGYARVRSETQPHGGHVGRACEVAICLATGFFLWASSSRSARSADACSTAPAREAALERTEERTPRRLNGERLAAEPLRHFGSNRCSGRRRRRARTQDLSMR
jgi:hypothetical protein